MTDVYGNFVHAPNDLVFLCGQSRWAIVGASWDSTTQRVVIHYMEITPGLSTGKVVTDPASLLLNDFRRGTLTWPEQ